MSPLHGRGANLAAIQGLSKGRSFTNHSVVRDQMTANSVDHRRDFSHGTEGRRLPTVTVFAGLELSIAAHDQLHSSSADTTLNLNKHFPLYQPLTNFHFLLAVIFV
jgi:hypothetical protein